MMTKKKSSTRWRPTQKQHLLLLAVSWTSFPPFLVVASPANSASTAAAFHVTRIIPLARNQRCRRASPPWRNLDRLHTKQHYSIIHNLPSASSLCGTSWCIATTVRASGVLVGSSLIGCLVERRSPSTGIVTTMLVAALCSNLSLVPSQHVLYDLCWSTFLPASLAFLLLSMDHDAPNDESANTNNRQGQGKESRQTPSSTQAAIKTVSVPFFLASIGSILGCTLSFFVCQMFPALWLSPREAAVAASCLCASFIGGTVNFFATANVILAGNPDTSLMSSMAGADLLVMAVYFSGLGVALKSSFLSSLFARGAGDAITSTEQQQPTNGNNVTKLASTREAKGTTQASLQKALAIGFVSVLGVLIVQTSSLVEKVVAPILPGTACAVIAGSVPPVQRKLLNASIKSALFSTEMKKAASLLSEFCLQLLFASIGVSAKIGEALFRGPACLCFSLFALSVHTMIALVGSSVVQHWVPFPLMLEDVLVASNAAIGGPATAAAFAGRIGTSRQRALTMAGTVWGVVGYAIGTTIGVALYQLLSVTAFP